MLREIAPEVKLEDLSELGSIHDNRNDDFPRPFLMIQIKWVVRLHLSYPKISTDGR